jgi:eukaryotic-like serine/threonine-protein kinase
MDQILKTHHVVRVGSSGITGTIEQFLGSGGQGEVYRLKLGGAMVALKWYFPKSATTQQRTALEMLVKKGPPTEKFLWPMELATAPDVPGFGYVMPLREARYKGIVDLMKRRIEPTFRALATAGLNLSHSYLQLHSQGFCYRDISFGNAFFDPKTGEILICDNDNVAVDGSATGGVLGTPDFMAPEIVCGKAPPSTQTDLFSLAVLLFYLFHIHHPLYGKKVMKFHCLDPAARTQLCGVEAVFIFDPHDRSNEAVPRPVDPLGEAGDNALAFWPVYPQFFRDLFTKAFTDGIRDPQNGRVRESEWRATMVRLRDAIVYCAQCGEENFYDAAVLKTTGGKLRPCWSCNKEVQPPPRIRLGKSAVVMFNHDTRLFPHHLDTQRMYDFSQPAAEVIRHPSNPRIWGLKNLSPEKWVCTTSDGTVKDVPPGRSVTLALGTKINFGKMEGEIRL